MACDILTLAADGSDFNTLSVLEWQAAKVYLLAQLLKANGGADYTDIGALAASLASDARKLTPYEQRSAYLQLLRQEALEGNVPEITPAQFNAAIQAGHCATPDSMLKAELVITCELLAAQRQA